MKKRSLIIILLMILVTFSRADFNDLSAVIELEGDEYFIYDKESGVNQINNFVIYAVIKINPAEEVSSLQVYRCMPTGQFWMDELASWEVLPQYGQDEIILQQAGEFFLLPQVFTSNNSMIRIFYEDVESGEIMLAETDEPAGEFAISASPNTDEFCNPMNWYHHYNELWHTSLEYSAIPVSYFQVYLGTVFTVNGDQDVSRFWGQDVLEGEVYANSDIWIQQAGGGGNYNWPTFNALVTSLGLIIDSGTGNPAGQSAPMEDIFVSGLLEEYLIEYGEDIVLPELAEDVRNNGYILEGSQARDILYAKINGSTAECRYADIMYEEMEFTVYNSYPDPLHPNWEIGDSIWTNVVQVPQIEWDEETFEITINNNSVFCWCELWIEGEVSGRQTWASADTIYITNDLTYASITPGEPVTLDCPDMLGLISEKNIMYKYKHYDPWVDEIAAPNCDGITIYGSLCALRVAEPNSAYPSQEEGVITFEYQHPHGSTPDFEGVSPFTGNDTLFSYIDLHKYVLPPAESYTGNPDFILHSADPPGYNYACCGYPYEVTNYQNPEVAPYGTDAPFYNPVWPESAADIVWERGDIQHFGSTAQRRKSFIHRNGSDPVSHCDNIIDPENYLYGGTHHCVGYGKDYHYDPRLARGEYPPDFVKVDNYFKQYLARIYQGNFEDVSDFEEVGSLEMLTNGRIKPLAGYTGSSEEEFVLLFLNSGYGENLVEVVFGLDGELQRRTIELEEIDDFAAELREVMRLGDNLFIETAGRLYKYDLAGGAEPEVLFETIPPGEWHDFLMCEGVIVLVEMAEGSHQIDLSYVNEDGELSYLYSEELPGAESLTDWYDKIDFGFSHQELTSALATYAYKEETGAEYYRKLYCSNGNLELADADENEIEPVTAGLKVYPNPFNPELTIEYSATVNTEETEINIFNIKGQRVKSHKIQNSEFKINQVVWDGKDDSGRLVSSGIYFVRMRSGEETIGCKAVMMK